MRLPYIHLPPAAARASLLAFSLFAQLSGGSVVISGIQPDHGAAYFSVTILGTGLQNATSLTFNGKEAICFHAEASGLSVTAVAPYGVSSGIVAVETPQGSATSPKPFLVISGADPTADFAARDKLSQTTVPKSQWCTTGWNSGWGPHFAVFPSMPSIPAGVDALAWARARFIAAALHFRGLPYKHHHIPAFDATVCTTRDPDLQVGPGLDCSNFTSWVLNYAFGLSMTSSVTSQAGSTDAGTFIGSPSALQPGDLLFITGSPSSSKITHVALYVDPDHRIDSHASGVDLRAWGTSGWPTNSFDHARRPLDRLRLPSSLHSTGHSNAAIRPNQKCRIVYHDSRGIAVVQNSRLFDIRGKIISWPAASCLPKR